MEKIIAILKTYKDYLQFLHWNTGKDYASHLLFERLMGDIDDNLDRLVEVYLGINDEVLDFKEYKKQVIEIEDIKAFIQKTKAELVSFSTNKPESVQNVVVDIIEMFDRHLYLL